MRTLKYGWLVIRKFFHVGSKSKLSTFGQTLYIYLTLIESDAPTCTKNKLAFENVLIFSYSIIYSYCRYNVLSKTILGKLNSRAHALMSMVNSRIVNGNKSGFLLIILAYLPIILILACSVYFSVNEDELPKVKELSEDFI